MVLFPKNCSSRSELMALLQSPSRDRQGIVTASRTDSRQNSRAPAAYVGGAHLRGVRSTQPHTLGSGGASGSRAADDAAPPAVPPSKEQVSAALHGAGGNKVLASRRLGVSRRALYRLIEKHRLEA